MSKVNILKLLDGKWDDGTRPKDLYGLHVSKDPKAYAKTITDGLRAGSRRVRNGCAELASLLSADSPELLYPHVDVFLENLGASEPVLRWEAACTIGNLAPVDREARIPASIQTLIGLLSDKSIVLQGHAVRALAKCAQAYPKEAARILDALTKAAGRFPGNRVGYLIEAMGPFSSDARFEKKVSAFVEPYSRSDIKSVAGKAGKILKKIGASRKKRRS